MEACKEDKREKLVAFTESGKLYAHQIIEPLLNVEERVYKKIGYERMEQMQETMELFNMIFEKEVEKSNEENI